MEAILASNGHAATAEIIDLPLPAEVPAPEPDDAGLAASRAIVAKVLESLDESKAEEVVDIDIEGKSALADHMVIASGRSHRHVGAVSDRLLRDLKEAGFGAPKVEGQPANDWVLIDTGDVIVHIFRPEVREFYNLEKMWQVTAEA